METTNRKIPHKVSCGGEIKHNFVLFCNLRHPTIKTLYKEKELETTCIPKAIKKKENAMFTHFFVQLLYNKDNTTSFYTNKYAKRRSSTYSFAFFS